LIRGLDDSYRDYLSTVGGLDQRQIEKKWLDGQWGVRDITAHITGWMRRMGAALEQMARGEKPEHSTPFSTETDQLNATFALQASAKTHEQILHDLEYSVQSFKDSALKLPDERFEAGRTAPRLFEIGAIEHFREHADMIREWRKREGV